MATAIKTLDTTEFDTYLTRLQLKDLGPEFTSPTAANILESLKGKDISTIVNKLEQLPDKKVLLEELKKFATLKIEALPNANVNGLISSAVDTLLKLTLKHRATQVYIHLYHIIKLKEVEAIVGSSASKLNELQTKLVEKNAETQNLTNNLTKALDNITKLKEFVQKSASILDASSQIQNILQDAS